MLVEPSQWKWIWFFFLIDSNRKLILKSVRATTGTVENNDPHFIDHTIGYPTDYSMNYPVITFRGKNMRKKKHMRSPSCSQSPPGAILANLLVIWRCKDDYNKKKN